MRCAHGNRAGTKPNWRKLWEWDINESVDEMPRGMSVPMSPVTCLYSKTPGTQDHTARKGLK